MPKKVQVKEKITVDYICDEYDRIKKIKDEKERKKELDTLKILSQNIGGYLVK
tara:strand:- start:33274 stop:33432 length:159 start_codon:yes stop_codon:yes gene_type:complete